MSADSAASDVMVVEETTEIDTDKNESNSIEAKSTSFQDVAKNISFITKGIELNQPRLLQRAIRQNANIRRYASKSLLHDVVTKTVPPTCQTFSSMLQAIEKIPQKTVDDKSAEEKGTDDDLNVSFSAPFLILPEVEVYLFTLIVTTLLREKCDADAAFSATVLVDRIRTFNRRSLDIFSSKAYFYLSLAYENIQRLENIRPVLLTLYRTSCVRHDEMGQAVLLNLILRNYLHFNLIEQAQTLSLRTSFPENASNNQFCRYLYYMGRIQAIQLEYSEAFQRLSLASRKAPQDVAKGFGVEVTKLSIIVQLLMGDIPERSTFNQPEYRLPLRPYLLLTQAVRTGDLKQFNNVVAKYGQVFRADKNLTLVHRLGHNVLKIGLRKLSLSYSRISLADIASKLHLPSVVTAEYICAKAIRDGVVEATIDHAAGMLITNEVLDVYSTEEPQKAFHKRIAFCLDVHNDAVKGMRYPPDAYRRQLQEKDKKGKEKDDKEEKTIEELIKEMEDEMED